MWKDSKGLSQIDEETNSVYLLNEHKRPEPTTMTQCSEPFQLTHSDLDQSLDILIISQTII